jgi:two-component system CheB/CheR fusion protein
MFHYILKKNGLLFLGKSESLGQLTNLFSADPDKKIRLFRKINNNNNYPIDFIGGTSRKAEISQANTTTLKESPTSSVSLEQRLESAVIDYLMPAVVIVDDKSDIIYTRNNVSPYLNVPTGKMDTNLLKMIRDDLRVDARTLLHKSRREGVVKGPRILLKQDKQNCLVSITVIPLSEASETPVYLWALLFESEPYNSAIEGNVTIEADQALQEMRISELEQELLAMREHLQTTVEELETSNEELQSTNEELQSANEELQSTNEEIETANEELQSTNEELSTVNQELQIKSNEVSSVNSDLENILSSLSLPMLVVDNRLRITRYSTAARGIFDIKHSDIGQIITSLNTSFVMNDLRNHIYSVIESGSQKSLPIANAQQTMTLSITPYFSESRRIVGAVLLFESLRDSK